MRILAFISLAFVMIFSTAMAEQSALDRIDLSAIEKWAGESRTDVGDMVRKLASGEFEMDYGEVFDEIRRIALDEIKKAFRYMALICVPCLILASLKVIYPDSDAVYTLGIVCSLAVTAALVSLFSECLVTTKDFLNSIGAFNSSLYPVLATLLALSGKSASSALFTPSAALVGSFISDGIAVYSPVFAGCAAALAAAGQLSRNIRLEGLERIVRRVYNIGLGVSMTVVTCLLATRGELAKGYDSSSIQTAKFTVGSLLPIVGGEVADSIDTIVTSASLVKNAVGVAGLILLLSACMKPVVTLAIYSLTVRLSSAIAEPLGDSAPKRAAERFSDALDMLLAACVSSVVCVMILVGAAMTIFGG